MRNYKSWSGLRACLAAAVVAVAVIVTPATHAAAPGSGAVVSTGEGELLGTLHANYRDFLGIPYAAPPVGALRWKPTQPPAPWTGVRDATRFGSACPQIFIGGDTSANEDCLYLNVYTPNPVGTRLPVMVWIHGGGFINGSGKDYDASLLSVRGDVVVVTINYRLGAFGFLALPGLRDEDPHQSTGNYGLLDQQQALRWVHDNIAAFGGDPGNVTIFGESAGAASVCDQIISPLAAGLFHKAITESGACGGPLQPVPQSVVLADGEGFAAAAGCSGSDAAAVVSCMRGKTSWQLEGAAPLGLLPAGEGYVPSIDGYIVPGSLGAVIGSGHYNKVPVLEGTNRDEWRLFLTLNPHAGLSDATYTQFVEQNLGANAAAVLQQYPLSAYLNNPDGEASYLAYSAIETDSVFSCVARGVDAMFSTSVPVYAYEFADPSPPVIIGNPHMKLGPAHASELLYVFQTNLWAGWLPVSRLTPAQRALSTTMQSYWTNFARNGDPNGSGLPAWPVYTGTDGPILGLASGSGGIAVDSGFAAFHHCAFWTP
ncbi:MAG: carboxylesterase family protein [Nevskia sp.]|nr:carboxylesterase family protein [Nevskia sp.]